MKKLRIVGVVGAAMLVLLGIAAPAMAQTEPVDEALDILLTCRATAQHPNPSNATITSTGSFGCGRTVLMEITVCLELAQIPVACKSKGPTVTSGLSATTDPIQCIPGLYQTRTVGRVIAPIPMTHSIHSIPPVLIVQCV